MLKKIRHFLKEYRLLSFVILIIAACGILDITGKDLLAHWVMVLTSLTAVVYLCSELLLVYRSGRFGMPLLPIAVICTSVLMKEFWVSMLTLLLFAGSRLIETFIEKRIKQNALAASDDHPDHVHIHKIVRSAAGSSSPLARLVDGYSLGFMLLAFFVAGAAWFVTSSPHRFLQVLVVASPASMVIGVPLAVASGLGRAVRSGIVIRSGSKLEQLANTQTLVLTKTGILTSGNPTVTKVVTFHKFTKQDVLAHAASLEQSSEHPIAQAILAEAQNAKFKIPKIHQAKEYPGQGMAGRLRGKNVLVGSYGFLEDHGIAMAEPASKANKQLRVYVAIDDLLAGTIELVDEVRPEAKTMLERLKKSKVGQLLFITGDNVGITKTMSDQLHIKDMATHASITDKIMVIEAAVRPAAFVSNSAHDAPVLTIADVGITVGLDVSSTAHESADVLILEDNLSKIADALATAKHTFSVARQTVLIGILLSIGSMALFSTGRFKAIYGLAVQTVIYVVVLVSTMRTGLYVTKK